MGSIGIDRDSLVIALVALLFVVEILARLLFAFAPGSWVLWRKKRWWRSIRLLQALLILAAFAGLYHAYRYPSSPPGLLEHWLRDAEILAQESWREFDSSKFDIPKVSEYGLPDNRGADSLSQGRVTKVIDGDSMKIRLEGRSIEARLHGIDAPEWNQSYGRTATSALRWKVLWRKVDVATLDTDRYGRAVVVIKRNGRNINAEMVCDGHAWWYARYAPDDNDLKNCEGAARSQRLGLWKAAEPIPPWRWR